jgi:hypothetical protein
MLETKLRYVQGTDHRFVYTILNAAQTAAIDISGWALSFMAKRDSGDTDAAAVITKTTVAGIVISGVFNAAPASNTQIATLTIEDTDTLTVPEYLYEHELKRTDAGLETILSYGPFELVQGVHR